MGVDIQYKEISIDLSTYIFPRPLNLLIFSFHVHDLVAKSFILDDTYSYFRPFPHTEWMAYTVRSSDHCKNFSHG